MTPQGFDHHKRMTPQETDTKIGDDMTSPAASAFDMPDRLAAKSDPTLIAHDDQHFTDISASLHDKIADLEDRLDTLRREPGGRGQAGVQRDAEIRRLARQLRVLQRFGIDLCLGRIVRTDSPEPIYIGRTGLTSTDGRRLLIDWRAPAAEPFFAATHADPMGLVSRRRYRWTRGRISDYWDEVFAHDQLEGHVALDDQSAFIASLGRNRSSRMQDVLGTIQADQDAIIRASSQGALVVDGGPGTGKTVVALHRAARLLYSDPRLAGGGGGNVLFIGPTQAYRAYVDDVLPSLGEDAVQVCTLRDLVHEGTTAGPELSPEVARLKSSTRLAGAIQTAVTFYRQPPAHGMSVGTPWADLWTSPQDWREAFASLDPGTPHNEARAQVWETLQEILADQLADHVAGQLGEDEDLPLQRLRAYVARDEDLWRTFIKAWPLLDPVSVVAQLWSAPDLLRACAPALTAEEVELLQREEPRSWTVSDLPLLDEARHLIGDPSTAKLERRRQAALEAEHEQMRLVVDDLIQADDGEGLVTMLRQDDLQDKLIDDAALPSIDPDLLAGPFGHIIVDEAQELTDGQWQMVLRRCPSRSLTIVGDRAQARHGFSETWSERLHRVGLSSVAQSSLSINYRTPQEVMAEAAPIIRSVLPDANVPESIRSSGVPVAKGVPGELDALLQRWLTEHPEGTACVIGDPTFTPTRRVRSMAPEEAKGLEFDLVALINPEGFGDTIEVAVDRYVAMTRAVQQLVILSDS